MPQQATMGPAPMEGVERTNAVVVRGQGQGMGIPPRWDPFAMEVDHGRNCYHRRPLYMEEFSYCGLFCHPFIIRLKTVWRQSLGH